MAGGKPGLRRRVLLAGGCRGSARPAARSDRVHDAPERHGRFAGSAGARRRFRDRRRRRAHAGLGDCGRGRRRRCALSRAVRRGLCRDALRLLRRTRCGVLFQRSYRRGTGRRERTDRDARGSEQRWACAARGRPDALVDVVRPAIRGLSRSDRHSELCLAGRRNRMGRDKVA